MIVSTLAIASGLLLVGWDPVGSGGHRDLPDELLARLAGQNDWTRNSTQLTDCMELHSIPPDGVPMSHCWNYDELLDGFTCHFCTNDNTYPYTYPGGDGRPMVSGGSYSCGTEQFRGICEDSDGNGQYRCTQTQEEPAGSCDEAIEIHDYVHQRQ